MTGPKFGNLYRMSVPTRMVYLAQLGTRELWSEETEVALTRPAERSFAVFV